jgi:E3 ubiquitin-protein ligase ATL10/75/76/77/78
MDMEQMHARRLLSHAAAAAATPAVASTPGPSGTPRSTPFGSADDTVITILSLLLCVLVVALVLRAFVRCACRVCYGQTEPPGAGDVEAGVQMAALQALAGAVAVASASSKKKGKGKGAAIRAIPTVEYSAEIELAVCSSTECAICLTEFAQGERVRVLPRCHHGFHVRCIDRWLSAHQTCPTCRREPFSVPTPQTTAEEPAPAAVQLQVVVVEAGQSEHI